MLTILNRATLRLTRFRKKQTMAENPITTTTSWQDGNPIQKRQNMSYLVRLIKEKNKIMLLHYTYRSYSGDKNFSGIIYIK